MAVLVLAGSLSYHVAYGHTPIAANFHVPRCGAHCTFRSQLLGYIPPDAAVSAQTTLVPHVSQRQAVYEYPQGLSVVDYVLLDVTSPQYAIATTDQFYASIDSLWQSGDFSLLAAQDGYLLFERRPPASNPDMPESFYSYATVQEPMPSQPAYVDFGPVTLAGADFNLDQFVMFQAQIDFVDDAFRQTVCADHDNRFQGMTQFT